MEWLPTSNLVDTRVTTRSRKPFFATTAPWFRKPVALIVNVFAWIKFGVMRYK